MSKRRDALAVLLLAALTILFFWKLALTNLIMVGVDIFTYFYPYRTAINESLVQGHLPLWNPYLFMGVPLLANGQAGVFYPLNWLFVGLAAPQAINYSIVLHVFLAALFFYLFARAVLGLASFGALVGASVYAFSGYSGSLVEHVNQLQAAAWFPLLLWCYESARRDAHIRFILLGGVVFALQLLAGHAQVSYISLAGLGVWIAGRLANESWQLDAGTIRSTFLSLISNLKPLIAMLITGIGLSAIQLLPMLELSRLSIRGGGMSFREAVAFSLPPSKLLVALLPTFGLGEVVFSEYIAFVGVVALLLGVIGVWRAGRRHLGLLLLLIVGFTFALGFYNPLYFVFYKLVPGFGLFRVPARWLFLLVFALAAFAAIGAQSLDEPRKLKDDYAESSFSVIRHSSSVRWVILLLSCIAITWLLARTRLIEMPAMPAPGLWLLAAALTLTLLRWRARGSRWALLALLLGELFTATRWLPYNQPTAPEAYSALRPSIAYLRSPDAGTPFRILSYSDLGWDPGDLKEIQSMFAGQLSAEAIYQFTVAAKSKEIVAPNLALRYHLQSVDGYDGGILPLARYVGLQSLFLTSESINPDGRLRERLRAIPAARWLDLFNVRYLIADKIFDVWVDGIYYDLGLGLDLKADDRQAYAIAVPADFAATGIGVISYLRGGASLPDDTPVAELLATDSLGRVQKFVLRAGRETAESEFNQTGSAHAQARAVHTLRDQPTANEYHAQFNFDTPTRLTALSARALQPMGNFILHGISLIDAASKTGKPLTFAADGHFRVVQSGDIKLYELVAVAPRAQVIHQAAVNSDDAQTLKRMSAPAFDPRTQLVLAAGQPLQIDAPVTAATIAAYDAERVVLRTDDPAEGYLLLKDTWYPGWHAWVDGQPTTIERANTYFRAIHLSAGSHNVELRFEPESLQFGAIISTLVLVACAGIAVWELRHYLKEEIDR